MHHMAIYRITERDARFIVGTDREAILICRSLEIAHQAIADAELLETLPAKLIFARRVVRSEEERLSLPPPSGGEGGSS
jgi:hypothetical protein